MAELLSTCGAINPSPSHFATVGMSDRVYVMSVTLWIATFQCGSMVCTLFIYHSSVHCIQVAQVAQVDSKYGTKANCVRKNSFKRELQWE